MKSKILFLLFPLLLTGCDWFDWNPPPSGGDAALAIHVTTNIGGPMIGPLERAPIDIVNGDGSIAAQGVSDKNGDLLFKLNPGTYIVDPQDIPNDDDFYTPPEQVVIILKADDKLEISLHYDNPIL
jgi:hypothetical protein